LFVVRGEPQVLCIGSGQSADPPSEAGETALGQRAIGRAQAAFDLPAFDLNRRVMDPTRFSAIQILGNAMDDRLSG
jgi:hypothetical protein